jgi:Icc-related predicted phosphoesterase
VREKRPPLHLFGHIHEDGGVWQDDGTCFANVTTWECERAPTVIDIDPITKRVTPVSVPARGR